MPYLASSPNNVGNFTEAGWIFQHIGGNRYKIYRSSITMTGLNVSTTLRIPFPHRIVRIGFYHTDSAYAASTDALAIIVRREQNRIIPSKFEEDLWNESGITDSKIVNVYGEKYEYEEGNWVVILNSTNTDLIIPLIYIQQLQMK